MPQLDAAPAPSPAFSAGAPLRKARDRNKTPSTPRAAPQDKLQILQQLRAGTGITHVIVGTYSRLRRVDDQLGELLAAQPSLAAGLHLHAFSQVRRAGPAAQCWAPGTAAAGADGCRRCWQRPGRQLLSASRPPAQLADEVQGGVPSDAVPLGLSRCAAYLIPHPIFNVELVSAGIDWGR
jgi:hypothetical protein